jgi:hypothetical protein
MTDVVLFLFWVIQLSPKLWATLPAEKKAMTPEEINPAVAWKS